MEHSPPANSITKKIGILGQGVQQYRLIVNVGGQIIALPLHQVQIVGHTQNVGEGDQIGSMLENAIKVMHLMKTFNSVTKNILFSSVLDRALSAGDATDTRKCLVFFLKCIIDDKHKGALLTLPKILNSMKPNSAIDVFNLKILEYSGDFQSRKDLNSGANIIASCISLAFSEVTSFIPGIELARVNSGIIGDCSNLCPLFTWPAFVGRKVLSLNLIVDNFVFLYMATDKLKAIGVLVCGSVNKLAKITYEQLRKEVAAAVRFDFSIYDPITDKIITDESEVISGPPTERVKSFKAVPKGMSTYNKQNWNQDRNISEVSYQLEGHKSQGADPEQILAKLTDIELYGNIAQLKPNMIVIQQLAVENGHIVEKVLGEKWSIRDGKQTSTLNYERAFNCDHAAIYELC